MRSGVHSSVGGGGSSSGPSCSIATVISLPAAPMLPTSAWLHPAGSVVGGGAVGLTVMVIGLALAVAAPLSVTTAVSV